MKLQLMNLKQKIRKARAFDYDSWIESQELKGVFPPRIIILLWIGLLGTINYNLVQEVSGSDLDLLLVSTFVVGCALCLGFMLGIEQNKNR